MAAAGTPAVPATAAVLAEGLAQVLGGPVQGVQRLSGGASQETWALQLQRPGQPAQPLILRRAPPGAALRGKGNAGLGAEAVLIRAAAAAGVPVPAVVAELQPEHGLGEGFVMQRLAGETLGRRVAAAHRPALAFQCGQALARIHALPVQAVPISSLGLRQSQPAEEVRQQAEWHACHGTVRPVFQLALRWLADHAPSATRLALVHGDFRNGNLMVDLQAEGGALVGVLDWELAQLGDPMADLGWLGMASWRYGQSSRAVGGFGHWAELFSGYRSAGGTVDEARVRWWQVMGSLRWGVICESMVHAWLTGTEPVMEKAAIGRRASECEIDLLELLLPRGGGATG